MRIVVFSDSHNNFAVLHKIIKAQPSAELFIHLGDGEAEFDDLCSQYPNKPLLAVRGNCDWVSFKNTEELLTCNGKRVFFTHGHLFNVKVGLESLKNYARGLGADIAMFGHTHAALTAYEDGLYLFNPGSVSLPKDGRPSYGILDITEAGIVTNIVRL